MRPGPVLFALALSLPVTRPEPSEGAAAEAAPRSVEQEARRSVRLEGSADFLELAAGSLWVTNEPKDLVHRLDARTGERQADVAVKGPAGAMAVFDGGLFVASLPARGLVRIDLRSNEASPALATGLADPEGELSLAATPEGVWVAVSEDGVVALVDPKARAVVARATVKPRSYGLAAGFGSVWATNTGRPGEPGSVQRLDPGSRRVVAEVPTGPSPRFLAVGEGAVWTLNQGDGTVTRIDPATNCPAATVAVGVPGTGGDVAAGEGFVWVRAKGVLLSVIDPRTNEVVARFGPPAGSGAVRVGPEGAWVSAHDIHQLWLLPPRP